MIVVRGIGGTQGKALDAALAKLGMSLRDYHAALERVVKVNDRISRFVLRDGREIEAEAAPGVAAAAYAFERWRAAQGITITLGRELADLPVARSADPTDKLAVQAAGYGWVLEDSEWALVVQWTSRQDGKTSWAITLTDVDGVARVRHGLTPWAEAAAVIGAAITNLTQEARWIEAIRVEVTE